MMKKRNMMFLLQKLVAVAIQYCKQDEFTDTFCNSSYEEYSQIEFLHKSETVYHKN